MKSLSEAPASRFVSEEEVEEDEDEVRPGGGVPFLPTSEKRRK